MRNDYNLMDASAPLAALVVALLWVLSLFIQPIANVFYSLHLTKLGVHHLLRSNDKRCKSSLRAPQGVLPASAVSESGWIAAGGSLPKRMPHRTPVR